MVKGKTGDVADFDESELRKLKAKMDNHRAPRAAVVKEGDESPEHEPRSLARLSDVEEAHVMANLLQRFVTIFQQTEPAQLTTGRQSKPVVPITSKLTLSIADAAELSGLSENFIREAIHGKKLKAAIRGRGYNIKKTDLELFIKKL